MYEKRSFRNFLENWWGFFVKDKFRFPAHRNYQNILPLKNDKHCIE